MTIADGDDYRFGPRPRLGQQHATDDAPSDGLVDRRQLGLLFELPPDRLQFAFE
jgi:hypothetical protein